MISQSFAMVLFVKITLVTKVFHIVLRCHPTAALCRVNKHLQHVVIMLMSIINIWLYCICSIFTYIFTASACNKCTGLLQNCLTKPPAGHQSIHLYVYSSSEIVTLQVLLSLILTFNTPLKIRKSGYNKLGQCLQGACLAF